MCGLAGFLDFKTRFNADALSQIVAAMADEIRPRGPDDSGVHVDQGIGLAFGFRRLAIIDLTQAGHQPMVSASGRTMIIFNGEIYNAENLRGDLIAIGRKFRGHSDTEVLLEACEAWGLEVTLARSIGMFAMAIYDNQSHELKLIRDRFGKKPLYFGSYEGCLIFGSQPRVFRPHPLFKSELDEQSFSAYIRFGYVPPSASIYQGMQQVPPGAIARIRSNGDVSLQRYWQAETVAAECKRFPVLDEAEALVELDARLRDAVRLRMVSDVPLGAFLSGGNDSSLVVALMQAQSADPVKTFTIGFREEQYNEARFALEVANHLGTKHHEVYLSATDALAVIPGIADHFDEPFGDSSQIPTYLVSRMARQDVTVALSGDGGDELFAGYSRYIQMQNLPAVKGPVVRQLALLGHRALAASTLTRMALPPNLRVRADCWLKQLGAAASKDSLELHYRTLVSQGFDPSAVLVCDREVPAALWNGALSPDFPDMTERMQIIDVLTYLPGDILTKVDRASMANSLEVRSPLLDHRVMEFAWSLPLSMKVRGGEQKWALKRVLERYVPRAMFSRPKMGFGVPIEHWLRGPLRDWAEDLLDPSSLSADGLFDVGAVRDYWRRHLAGETWQYGLWSVLMFQAWKRRWLKNAPVQHAA